MSHSCLACTGDKDCPLLVYFASLQQELEKLRRRNAILLADVQTNGQEVIDLKKEVNYWRAAYGPGPKYYDVSDDEDSDDDDDDE